MKKIALLALPAILLLSCSDDSIVELNKTSNENPQAVMEGMQRIKVASRADINNIINDLENYGNNPLTRSGALSDVQMSDNEELFVSLVEANRKKVMESLTPAQLDSIRNDEDELEFCPSDSVIADIRFAQLLNAAREIQVSDTVYKYTSKGVAYTKEEFASELNFVDENTKDLVLTEDNVGQPMRISQNVTFIPVDYISTNIRPVTDTTGDFTGWETGGDIVSTITDNGIELNNGYTIPNENIRDVNYAGKGDGNWLHRTWTKIFGRNIVAVNKFSDKKRLYLNFYDQNYIIYSNIGTELKMQKKVCGIWWNIKADELVLGWQTVINKYTMPKRVLDMFPKSPNNNNEYPASIKYPFPFNNEDKLLLHIPFIDYDFTTKDLNKAFNAGLKLAINKASTYFKKEADKNKDNLGLYTAKGRDFYTIIGPSCISDKGKKTIEKRFFNRWLPGTYVFTFSIYDIVKFISAKVDGNDNVELYRGIVYGAIKYDGKWIAARITKDSDTK